jgi:hypothetical protein
VGDFKFEILSTKHETNSKFKFFNDQNAINQNFEWVLGTSHTSGSPSFEELLGFGNLDFENLYLFRISIFGFRI